MKKKDLLDYKFAQMENVTSQAKRLRTQGLVKDYKDVYPDVFKRIHTKTGTAYIRGNVPLKLMAIIYDTVIVSVPPLSKKQLESRFDVEWNDFIKLCEHNIVIPIIGDAELYTARHFDQMFKLPNSPCSLLARGLALLDVFGMSDTLSIAKDVLPIDQIADEITILEKWKVRYPTLPDEKVKELIKRDTAIQYADLCIFGLRSQAGELVSLPPQEIYNSLKLMNEIRTYPILFGLNSQANFNYQKLQSLSSVSLKDSYFSAVALPPRELEILLEGIGVDIDNVTVEDIITYHNDSLGINLRKALQSFNGYCNDKLRENKPLSPSEVCKRAEEFQNSLKDALRDLDGQKYAKIDKAHNAITKFLKIGTIMLGGAIAINDNTSQVVDVLALLGAANAIMSALPEETASIITKIGVQSMESSFMANMWAARRVANRR